MMLIYGGNNMEWKTEYLIPGMVLKEDLLADNGIETAPLLPAGKEITFQDIARLKKHQIESVKVEEYDETFFNTFRKFAISNIKSYNIPSVSFVAEMYKYIAEKTSDFKFDMTRYLNEDFEVNNHSVNVANMAVALATKYNQSAAKTDKIDIKEMAEIAMLSEYGRLAKNPVILNKLKKDYGGRIEAIRKVYPNLPKDAFDTYYHELSQFYAYFILKGSSNFSNTQLTAILLDQEKEKDKNGPLGIELGKEDPMHMSVKMAKILRICKNYDRLLYRSKEYNIDQPFGKMNNYLDKMVASGLSDAYWTKMIKQVVPIYPLGEKVELSDGTIGVVAEQNSLDITNPKVIDLNGNEVPISKNDGLVIVALYNDPNKNMAPMQMSAGG